jgi:hypothetical protein
MFFTYVSYVSAGGAFIEIISISLNETIDRETLLNCKKGDRRRTIYHTPTHIFVITYREVKDEPLKIYT